MTPTEAIHPRAQAAGAARAPTTGTGSEGADDAFAALLEGLALPEAGAAAAADAGPGAAAAEGPPAAACGGSKAQAPDAVLPEVFLGPAAPSFVPPPGLACTAAQDTGSARDARATDAAGRGGPAAAWSPAAANDSTFAPADPPAARPGAFQALLAAAAPCGMEPRSEPAPLDAAADLPVAPLAPGLAGSTGTALPAAAVPLHNAALPSPPQSPAFAGELGAEVRWMVQAGVQQAELQLNPAELGPIQVQLTLTGPSADIQFTALHGMTRDSLQQALPVLREMLAQDGLQLGNAGIAGGQAGQDLGHRQRAQPQQRAVTDPEPGASAAPRRAGVASLRAGRGMLDLYA